MILWYHDITIVRCGDTMILWYDDIMILWYHDIMILWYYDIMILLSRAGAGGIQLPALLCLIKLNYNFNRQKLFSHIWLFQLLTAVLVSHSINWASFPADFPSFIPALFVYRYFPPSAELFPGTGLICQKKLPGKYDQLWYLEYRHRYKLLNDPF